MACETACIETGRNGSEIFLLHAGKRHLGLLATMTEVEYDKRLMDVIESGDSTRMFEPEDQYYLFGGSENGPVFGPGEVFAHSAYARAGYLGSGYIPDKDTVIAYENMRDLSETQKTGILL